MVNLGVGGCRIKSYQPSSSSQIFVTPFAFDQLQRASRLDAALASVIARWIAARSDGGERLSKLIGMRPSVRIVGVGEHAVAIDPDAAACEVRIDGASIDVRGSSAAVRMLAQRLLGGPDELPAARPLGGVEHAIWALVVAAGLDDVGIAAVVWPCGDTPAPAADRFAIELAIHWPGQAMTVVAWVPRSLALRAPPVRPPPGWAEHAPIDAAIVVGRSAIPRASIAALALRDVITLERARGDAELELLGGTIGLTATANAMVGEVATGYVRRDMSLPDDAHVELTVALGTTQLSLRSVFELAVGQVVPLGRPLAGPFELRAAGRTIGHGELMNVDGELAVRVVSLSEK
jgi:flagellar motor switch/type III secretory pathway protein FliN